MLSHGCGFICLSDVKDLSLRTKKQIFRVGKNPLARKAQGTLKELAVILWPWLVKPYVEIIRRSGEHKSESALETERNIIVVQVLA